MTSQSERLPEDGGGRRGGPATSSPSAWNAMWRLRGQDGTIATGWYLLPLRLFLGVTFLFAGLQKLSNPDFFRSSSPISIHAQLVGTAHTSPIGGLLGHLTGVSTAIGVAMALAEVAIGVGALLGLLTRVAALGGMVVSLSLFLAISFHTHPYYTGSDIVFLFTFTPFVLAGAAGAPALDTWLAARESTAVPVDPSRPDALPRGAFIAMVAGGAAVLAGVVAGVGRAIAPAPAPVANALGGGAPATTTTAPASSTTTTAGTGSGGASTTTTAAAPTGTAIGPASQVPVGGSASFTDPKSGDPSIVIQQTADDFVAFDAICPHAGCTVAYQASAKIIACPCHGSEFNPKNGDVVNGPATTGLNRIKVVKGANGDLYVV